MKNKNNEEEVKHNLPPRPAPPKQIIVPEENVKDEPSKHKKLKIGIIVGVSIVAAVGIIFLISNLISNNTKLSTPTNLEVVETTNGKTYVSVDKCNGAIKYKFEIINTNTEISTIYESEKNQFDATLIMGQPASYTITCQYIGKKTTTTSNYCNKVNHTTTKKIATPSISLGKYDNHNVLFVETANTFSENVLLTFTLIYTDGQIQYSYKIFEEQENNLSGLIRGYFNLDNIFTTTGKQYQLAVKVSQHVNQNEENYYLTSDLSSQVIYKVV